MTAELDGKIIGRYQISELLGQGGMALVYRAYDTRLTREVAIKIIRTDLCAPAVLDELLKRFEREAKALAQFDHPHIVHVHDYGEYEGSPYLVMQYLPGGTLRKKMGAPVDWQDTLRLMLPLAEALEYAHQREIIHRDIKPANILLTAEGQPKLTDFGIAKILQTTPMTALTGDNDTIGTPDYMAPEQAKGAPLDYRVDIYSLGIVLYEMITGCNPFLCGSAVETIIQHINKPLPSPRDFIPDLPYPVEQLLCKMLAKQPDERYDNMAVLSHEMETLLGIDYGATAPLRKTTTQLPVEPKSRLAKAPTVQSEAEDKPVSANLPHTVLPEISKPLPKTEVVQVSKSNRISTGKLLVGIMGLLAAMGICVFAWGTLTCWNFVSTCSAAVSSDSAAAINLQLDDLGAEFKMESDDSSSGEDVEDYNQRVFVSADRAYIVETTVARFDFMPEESFESLFPSVELNILTIYPNAQFSQLIPVELGDRAAAKTFTAAEDGRSGTIVIMLKENIMLVLVEATQLNIDTSQQAMTHAMLVNNRVP